MDDDIDGIDLLKETIRVFSEDIILELGTDKCTMMKVVRGKTFKFPVPVRLLSMCRGELPAIIPGLMPKCL